MWRASERASEPNRGRRFVFPLFLSPCRVGQCWRHEQLEPDGRRRVAHESFEHGGCEKRERLEEGFAPSERRVFSENCAERERASSTSSFFRRRRRRQALAGDVECLLAAKPSASLLFQHAQTESRERGFVSCVRACVVVAMDEHKHEAESHARNSALFFFPPLAAVAVSLSRPRPRPQKITKARPLRSRSFTKFTHGPGLSHWRARSNHS